MDINPSEKKSPPISEAPVAGRRRRRSYILHPFLSYQHLRNRRIPIILIGAIALVAAVAAITVMSNDSYKLQFSKNPSDVAQLFIRRQEELIPWKKKMIFQPGDQPSLHILAENQSLLWFDLYAPTGKSVLRTPEKQPELKHIPPGKDLDIALEFSPAVLTDGSILIILICNARSLEGLQPVASELADWLDGIFNHDQEFMNGCSGTRMILK